MPIPKIIYQTYKTAQLPLITRWHIKRFKQRNPEYEYQFYDDQRISEFIMNEYGQEIFALYSRISIGAAKADFFRYAILFKNGGVYLDIDSQNVHQLDSFILPNDAAIVSLESNQQFYVQWALIFEAEHPFLKRTLDDVLQNLKENKYPHDVHQMTGPTAFTKAIKACLQENPTIAHRQLATDYDGHFKFHYRFSKFFLYGLGRKNHWRKQQDKVSILKEA